MAQRSGSSPQQGGYVFQTADGAYYEIPENRIAEFRMSDAEVQKMLGQEGGSSDVRGYMGGMMSPMMMMMPSAMVRGTPGAMVRGAPMMGAMVRGAPMGAMMRATPMMMPSPMMMMRRRRMG